MKSGKCLKGIIGQREYSLVRHGRQTGALTMQALLSSLVSEKHAIGPCGVKEIKLVVATLWFVSDYLFTYLSS